MHLCSRVWRRPVAITAGSKFRFLSLRQSSLKFWSSEARSTGIMEPPTDYSNWSHEQLVDRVSKLERQLKDLTLSSRRLPPDQLSTPPLRPKKTRPPRSFDPSKYSTRYIALKFAYLGQRYNGYEYHANNHTPLPTIEEELWKALIKTRLIMPRGVPESRLASINWEACDYSKCGRTDKGVSAFGQVIGIRVRSKRPVPKRAHNSSPDDTEARDDINNDVLTVRKDDTSDRERDAGTAQEDADKFDPIKDEFPYTRLLNHVLPKDIRMLAWCPSPPKDFSARFSCRERRYRYFFTQPAFAPIPGRDGVYETVNGKQNREGWLDIDAMREAATHFVGLHDFRNFCKVDPTKQIHNFQRKIFYADIEELNPLNEPVAFVSHEAFKPSTNPQQDLNGPLLLAHDEGTPINEPVRVPRLFSFTVHGSAFLWHQIRHMVAILFLVGQGLENPSTVKELLDISKTPNKPLYDMAADAPLVLWDCIFPAEGGDSSKDSLEWIYVGDSTSTSETLAGLHDAKFGLTGVVDTLWRLWRRAKIDEVLTGSLLDLVANQGDPPRQHSQVSSRTGSPRSHKLFDGGNGYANRGEYVPILERKRMESVEVINKRYAERKGLESRLTATSEHNDDADE